MAANFEQRTELRPTGSKLDLIQATVAAISEHGLSELTSAKIAGAAGHTAASINFHFGSKEALLLATLREVSEEFAGAMARVMEEAGDDDLRALLGIIDASLGRALSDSHKIAVWYAFLAESKARGDYQRICGERDSAWSRMVIDLCKRLISARGNGLWPDAEAVAQGLMGLIDQQWQGILFEGDDFDREAARRQCRAYLCSVFPWLAPRIEATAPARSRAPAPEVAADPAIRLTLPAWVYSSEEFHELEKERLFLSSWQIVGHVSELKETGDYLTFEFFGRRGFVVKGADGEIRAFHNVCAHRAHAVVSGERGRCGKFLTCMYHGWTYHLDGRNRSISAPDTFPKFDRSKYGLKPIELEVFMGMVFIRFRGGEPSVAERMAPHVPELSHYRMAEMVPLDEMWTNEVAIDWKNVIENYVEDYHFPIGHPGLSALMEAKYDRESFPGGTMRLSHRMREKPLQVLECAGLREVPAGHRASAGRHAPSLDLLRPLSERVFRYLPRVARLLPRPAARRRPHADSRALLRLRRRPPRDEGCALPLRAAQCARAGGRRGPDPPGAARARVRRLLAGDSVGEGDRAGRIPGLDSGADSGCEARGDASARDDRLAERCAAVLIRRRADTTHSRGR